MSVSFSCSLLISSAIFFSISGIFLCSSSVILSEFIVTESSRSEIFLLIEATSLDNESSFAQTLSEESLMLRWMSASVRSADSVSLEDSGRAEWAIWAVALSSFVVCRVLREAILTQFCVDQAEFKLPEIQLHEGRVRASQK